jgi:hypothetical protein
LKIPSADGGSPGTVDGSGSSGPEPDVVLQHEDKFDGPCDDRLPDLYMGLRYSQFLSRHSHQFVTGKAFSEQGIGLDEQLVAHSVHRINVGRGGNRAPVA